MHVSTDVFSSDEPDCLVNPKQLACSTLNFVLTNILLRNESCIKTIFLDHYKRESETILVPEIDSDVKTVLTIACSKSCLIESRLDIFAKSFQRSLHIQMENISFFNSRITVGNVHVKFKNVQFLNSLVSDSQQTPESMGHLKLQFDKTLFEKKETTFETQTVQSSRKLGLILSEAFSAAISITGSDLIRISIHISVPHLYFEANNTNFVGSQINNKIDMFCITTFQNVSFTHESSNFEDRVPLTIAANQLSLTFIKCIVQNSAGGFRITKMESWLLESWIQVHMKDCKFQNISKVGSGAAVEVHYSAPADSTALGTNRVRRSLGTGTNQVKIQGALFIGNKVARLGEATSAGGAISIHGYTSTQNCLLLHVLIDSCNFTDNQAADGGGAIYVSDNCLATAIINSSFLATGQEIDSPKGVFVWSHSEIAIESSVFTRNVKQPSPSLIDFEMLSENAETGRLSAIFQCHIWYNLTSHTKFIAEELKEMRLSCTSCPASFYMPSDGQFSVSYLQDETGVVVQGMTSSGKSACEECPTGANCPGNDLNGKPNFWGSNKDYVITMYQCPADYCCTADCVGYNQCSGHRTGTLCGSCEENYSLSMLSADCIEATTCQGYWLWPLVFMAVLMYMAWYTFKNDLFQIPGMVKRRLCKNRFASSTADEVFYVDKGYFGIVTYFIQVKAVMEITISLDHTRFVDKIFDQIELYIQLALNFELSSVSNDTCAMKNLTTTKKTMFRLFFLFGIFLSWYASYILLLLVKYFMEKMKKGVDKLEKFKIKLVTGLVEIIKYTYLGFTSIVFYSLTCTSIGDHHVWYYDGSDQCYTRYQISMIVFGLIYLLPFPFLIYLTMKLLKNKKITRKSFFLANCFPLPVLLYWFCVSRKQNAVHDQDTPDTLDKDNKDEDVEVAIYEGFLGGFKESEGGAHHWESVLMFRRLLISATILFSNAMVQLALCLALCIAFLIHHLKKKPFVHKISNEAETLSLSLLCGIAAINLLKAAFLYADIGTQGPQQEILLNMKMMEIVFVVFVIGFIVSYEAGFAAAKGAKRVAVTQAWSTVLPFKTIAAWKEQQVDVKIRPNSAVEGDPDQTKKLGKQENATEGDTEVESGFCETPDFLRELSKGTSRDAKDIEVENIEDMDEASSTGSEEESDNGENNEKEEMQGEDDETTEEKGPSDTKEESMSNNKDEEEMNVEDREDTDGIMKM